MLESNSELSSGEDKNCLQYSVPSAHSLKLCEVLLNYSAFACNGVTFTSCFIHRYNMEAVWSVH